MKRLLAITAVMIATHAWAGGDWSPVEDSMRLLGELKEKGIAAGVYTQTTDVEGEINGLMTYDRKVIKITAEEARRIHAEAGLLD